MTYTMDEIDEWLARVDELRAKHGPYANETRETERLSITDNAQRVAWYRNALADTLARSKYRGTIHVIYDTPYYVRAVVDVNGMAYSWWYDTARELWRCNTSPARPPVPIERSRAAKRKPWDGS